MDKILKNICGLLTIGFICINMSSIANAAVADAVLTGIEISPINGSYEITVSTNKAVPIKTRSSASNKMNIELKGVTPSKSINTVYKNATGIDHVLVRPMGKDVRIILQGDNISSSQVLLNTSKIPLNLINNGAKKKTLVLNKSITSYRPLVEVNEELEEVPTQGFIIPTNIDLNAILTPSNLGWLMGLGSMFLFLFKSFQEQKGASKKPTETSFRTPQEELNKRRRALGVPPQEKINLQEELTKAHSRFNDSLSRKAEQRKAVENAFNKNAGLKEYQNSQLNPYNKVSRSSQMPNPIKQSKPQSGLEALKREAASKVNVASKKPAKRDVKKQQIKMNNMKFLDNMRNIYEKNGRVDLANSIQEQMKNKIN